MSTTLFPLVRPTRLKDKTSSLLIQRPIIPQQNILNAREIAVQRTQTLQTVETAQDYACDAPTRGEILDDEPQEVKGNGELAALGFGVGDAHLERVDEEDVPEGEANHGVGDLEVAHRPVA